MTKPYYMVFEVFRTNFTETCTAGVRLKHPLGARVTVLNADTAFVYSHYEDCHQVDRFIPASCYGNLGFTHLFFQICETAGYLSNLTLNLINYLGIMFTLLADASFSICFPVCNPMFKNMSCIEIEITFRFFWPNIN